MKRDGKKYSFILKEEEEILFTKILQGNLYIVEWTNEQETCLVTKTSNELSWLWHKRLSHLNFKSITKLARNKLALGIPDQVFQRDHVCEFCQVGKQARVSLPPVAVQATTQILELLHLDLFGPVTHLSINGRKYTLVVIDDFLVVTAVQIRSPTRRA